jgi:hypothetical protein
MTRLVDAVKQLGLDGEISLWGRWVRLQGERCPVYVLEVAGGCGYLTWCDDPGARTAETYLDPAEAIQAGLRRAARAAAHDQSAMAVEDRPWRGASGQKGGRGAEMDAPKVPPDDGHVCCVCGAVAGPDKALSYVRKEDAWFCDDCWNTLPPHEVEQNVQEIALRGVPLS